MYEITITKKHEGEERSITRRYDPQVSDEALEEAIIDMRDQLDDNRTMEDVVAYTADPNIINLKK